MSLLFREILGWATFVAVIWDTVLTFILIRTVIKMDRRLVRIEGKKGEHK